MKRTGLIPVALEALGFTVVAVIIGALLVVMAVMTYRYVRGR